MELPLEAARAFTSESIVSLSRDFSLQLFYHRYHQETTAGLYFCCMNHELWPLIYASCIFLLLTLYLIVSSADNFCKKFGARSGPTKCRAWFRSRLFNTLMVVFLSLHITIANSMDPDKARPNVWSDLDPNCLTLRWYSWKNFSKKFILKKNLQTTKKHENFPRGKESTITVHSL